MLAIGGRWPVPCFPQPAPAICLRQDALCYANPQGEGYAFVPMPRAIGQTFDRQRERSWVWNQRQDSAVQQALARLGWESLRRSSQSAPGAMVRAAYHVSWTYCLQSQEELLVYIAQPGERASLSLRLPGTMAGWLLDPEEGDEIGPVRVETLPWDITMLPVPAGRAAVLVLARVR